jgi:hypothetical protein
MYKTILTAACLFILSMSYGVQPYNPMLEDPLYQRWIWHSYQEMDGKGYRAMSEDKDGSLWFGLMGGVMRYNGIDWTLFKSGDGLYGFTFPTIMADVKGDRSIYTGSDAGLYCYCNEQWQTYPPFEKCPVMPVTRINKSVNRGIYVCTIWGLFQLEQDKVIRIITTKTLAAGIDTYFPGVPVITIPKDKTLREPWQTGFGLYTFGRVITALAMDGPAVEGGLKVGDTIESIEVLHGEASLLYNDYSTAQQIPAQNLSDSTAGDWSAFSTKDNHMFLSLPMGDHLLEVRARDRDFNVDMTPAVYHFTVEPPFYLNTWFLVPMLLLLGVSVFLEVRVIRRDKILSKINTALEQAKQETDNILHNVEEGLLLINKEYKIGSQYSAILKSIFERKNLANI